MWVLQERPRPGRAGPTDHGAARIDKPAGRPIAGSPKHQAVSRAAPARLQGGGRQTLHFISPAFRPGHPRGAGGDKGISVNNLHRGDCPTAPPCVIADNRQTRGLGKMGVGGCG